MKSISCYDDYEEPDDCEMTRIIRTTGAPLPIEVGMVDDLSSHDLMKEIAGFTGVDYGAILARTSQPDS